MWQYIIRRLFICAIVLIGVSMILYALIRIMPGDYVKNITTGNANITPEMIDSLSKMYGLDTNIIEGYARWFGKAIQGDFGMSFMYKRPVAEVINERMWVSFSMSLPAFILQLLIGIPLGVLSATKPYSKLDYGVTTFAFLGLSMPSFFFAAILQRIFAIGLKVVPLNGMIDARKDYQGFELFLDKAHHLILPILVMVFISVGSYMRFSRSNMMDVLNSDYIRTARAKGLSERAVTYTHAFRNTLIPLVTIIGGSLPALFSGAILLERIFAIQGIGWTGMQALSVGDIPFIMGFYMFLAVLTLLGTLISDLLYAVVDPRVRMN